MNSMTAIGVASSVTPAKVDAAPGRAPSPSVNYEVTVEVRSVNSRYLDLTVKMPRSLGIPEDRVKKCLSDRGICRGKVDIVITCERKIADAGREGVSSGEGIACREGINSLVTVVDPVAAGCYIEAAKTLESLYGIEASALTVDKILGMPGVMIPLTETAENLTRDEAFDLISPALADAIDVFVAARAGEGQRLHTDLCKKLGELRDLRAKLESLASQNVEGHRKQFEQRLKAALSGFGLEPDPAAILGEVAVYADKVCVDEELVRLSSHFDALSDLMSSPGDVGKRLDFMIQEINREVNTVGSKCCNADMARVVVDAKNLVEKMREQVQNIE